MIYGIDDSLSLGRKYFYANVIKHITDCFWAKFKMAADS